MDSKTGFDYTAKSRKQRIDLDENSQKISDKNICVSGLYSLICFVRRHSRETAANCR